MPGTKTNEKPGTRAVLRHTRLSATKARQVLDLIRGLEVDRAAELLATTPREAAAVVAKVLHSAVANAQANDGQEPDELYVSACFADEGSTLKRWRPRARGRATRIRKRSCHITVIVSRLPPERLARRQARAAAAAGSRRRRVAASRGDVEAPGESNRAQRRSRRRGQEVSEAGSGVSGVEPEGSTAAAEAEGQVDEAQSGTGEDEGQPTGAASEEKD